MKVARKSPKSRHTLTLPEHVFRQIDSLRGKTPRSVYLATVLKQEELRRKREKFLAEVNAAYTPAVVRQTLRVNEAFPVDES